MSLRYNYNNIILFFNLQNMSELRNWKLKQLNNANPNSKPFSHVMFKYVWWHLYQLKQMQFFVIFSKF